MSLSGLIDATVQCGKNSSFASDTTECKFSSSDKVTFIVRRLILHETTIGRQNLFQKSMYTQSLDKDKALQFAELLAKKIATDTGLDSNKIGYFANLPNDREQMPEEITVDIIFADLEKIGVTKSFRDSKFDPNHIDRKLSNATRDGIHFTHSSNGRNYDMQVSEVHRCEDLGCQRSDILAMKQLPKEKTVDIIILDLEKIGVTKSFSDRSDILASSGAVAHLLYAHCLPIMTIIHVAIFLISLQ